MSLLTRLYLTFGVRSVFSLCNLIAKVVSRLDLCSIRQLNTRPYVSNAKSSKLFSPGTLLVEFTKVLASITFSDDTCDVQTF